MSLEIPCTPNGQARWTQRTQLSGRDYQLTFDWNQRLGQWSLSIADQDGVPIRTGVRLVSGWPLLRGVIDSRSPPGVLAIDDMQNTGLDPGFSDLGTGFKLVYFDPSELPK
jgi:hypothetical protein